MTSLKAQGEAMIKAEDSGLQSIQKLTITVQAETLKSGKSGMDNNAYKALKTKKKPEISFVLKQVKSLKSKQITIRWKPKEP